VTGETTHRGPGAPGSWDHPSPEELAAYQANELSPERDDAIQEHLAGCSLCTQALLDLHRFLDPPEEDRPREGVADLETAVAWRKLRGKIEAEKRGAPRERISEPSPRRRSQGAPRTAYALAAVFAMATLGLSLYVVSLKQELRLSGLSPRLLFLSSATTRAGEPKAVELPQRRDELVAVVLILPPGVSNREYRVEVHRQQGGKVFEKGGLEAQPDGVVFLLPSSSLDSGPYEIKLEGLSPGKVDLIGQYEVEIRK
jgi:hypothetical protein